MIENVNLCTWCLKIICHDHHTPLHEWRYVQKSSCKTDIDRGIQSQIFVLPRILLIVRIEDLNGTLDCNPTVSFFFFFLEKMFKNKSHLRTSYICSTRNDIQKYLICSLYDIKEWICVLAIMRNDTMINMRKEYFARKSFVWSWSLHIDQSFLFYYVL